MANYCKIEDASLCYELTGSGPTLVLIHGFALDARIWDAQYAALAQHFQVLRYDLRGFGRSSLPTAQPYSHAADLHNLLDHLAIDAACIIGLSMGGWIATNFALNYPQQTRALILASPALVGWDWTPEWKALWSAVKKCAQAEGIDAAKKVWEAHPVFALARKNPAARAKLAAILEDYSGWHWLNAQSDLQLPIAPPDIERLDQIAAPTLIVRGADDVDDFSLCADILQHNIPNAKSIVLQHTGHIVNLEQPVAFNAAVIEFLHALDFINT